MQLCTAWLSVTTRLITLYLSISSKSWGKTLIAPRVTATLIFAYFIVAALVKNSNQNLKLT
jgi:hypothetical protein